MEPCHTNVVVKLVEVVVVNFVVLMTDITVVVDVGSERHSQAVVSREQAKPESPAGAPVQMTGFAVVFLLGGVEVIFVLVVVGFPSAVRFFLLSRPTHVLDCIVL
jgi:hypothetical protein